MKTPKEFDDIQAYLPGVGIPKLKSAEGIFACRDFVLWISSRV
jgi:hypothetical protein